MHCLMVLNKEILFKRSERLQVHRFNKHGGNLPVSLPTVSTSPTFDSPEFVSEILKYLRLGKDKEVYVTFMAASITRTFKNVTKTSAS